MPPFQDYAIARFVVCCSERVAPVVPSGRQNAILRRACCKRRSFHLRARTCCELLIVPSRAEPVVFRAQMNFARQFVDVRAGVPW